MRKTTIILLMTIFCACCCSCAGESFADRLDPVAAALRTGNLVQAMAFTNLLETLAVSAPSVEDAATCRIVETYILLDASDTEADDSAYVRATNLCMSTMCSLQGHTNAWQLYCCELAMADALTVDGKHAESVAMKTNLFERLAGRQLVVSETNLWESLSCYLFESNSISFFDAVGASTALSKAAMKDGTGMGVYTNGLPAGVVGIVDSLLK